MLRDLGPGFHEVLARHDALLRAAWNDHDGHEVKTMGDAFFVVFERAGDAVRGAVAAQRAIGSADWPTRAATARAYRPAHRVRATDRRRLHGDGRQPDRPRRRGGPWRAGPPDRGHGGGGRVRRRPGRSTAAPARTFSRARLRRPGRAVRGDGAWRSRRADPAARDPGRRAQPRAPDHVAGGAPRRGRPPRRDRGARVRDHGRGPRRGRKDPAGDRDRARGRGASGGTAPGSSTSRRSPIRRPSARRSATRSGLRPSPGPSAGRRSSTTSRSGTRS